MDANLKLQHPGREAGDAVLQARGQLVGDEFEVHKQRRFRLLRQLAQKKFQDAHRGVNFQVKSAVHKLESACAACIQIVQRCQKFFQLESPGSFVQGAQAKRAFEWAAARGLHVQNPLRQVGVAVVRVGQGDLVQGWLLTCDGFHQRARAEQKGAAQLGKAHIAPAGDHVVGQRHDGLGVGLVADFGAAEHDADLRPLRAQRKDYGVALFHVPDVNTQADYVHITGSHRTTCGNQGGGNVCRGRLDGEFAQHRAVRHRLPAMALHIGQQVAQPQTGVHIAGVQRGEHNAVGHKGIIRARAMRRKSVLRLQPFLPCPSTSPAPPA